MLFYCDAGAGGLRIFVRRSESYYEKTRAAIQSRERSTGYPKADPDPGRGWIFVTPKELGLNPEE
jgi:hypothetical protein